MLREVHPLGVQRRHSYDELVRYIELDPTKLKFPNRKAYIRRNHPFMTQDDGAKASLSEQRRVIDYRMGDNPAPYQPPPPHMEHPAFDPPFYDADEDTQDMFARAYQPSLPPAEAPDTAQNALRAEGFNPPPRPSTLSQLTSRVGENVTQGALNAVSQYSQDAAANALGWMGRRITDTARFQADFYK